MSVFTVSPYLLENIEEDEKVYLSDILFVFTQRNTTFKVAKDKNGEILDIYKGINNNAEIIKIWLDLMSFKPAKFEKIDIDLSDIVCVESKFFELCSYTNNTKNLIVYSKQNILKFQCINNIVNYNDINISILDRDDANAVLNSPVTITTQNNYVNSQIASHGSQISDSNNN